MKNMLKTVKVSVPRTKIGLSRALTAVEVSTTMPIRSAGIATTM